MDGFDAERGAPFRYHAREVLGYLNPICKLWTPPDRPELQEQYEPVRERFAKLKRAVSGMRLATDLAVAEADAAYVRSITLVECSEPPDDTELYIANEIKSMSGHLEKMEAIAQKGGAE